MTSNDSQHAANGRTLARLQKNQRLLKALISSSFDAIIAIDVERKIVSFNRQAELLLGYSGSEMEGQSVVSLHEDKEKAREIYRIIQDFGKIERMEVVLVHKDGRKIPVLLSGKQIVDEKGNILGQVGYMRDMRDIRSLETRLKELIETSKTVNSIYQLDEILEHVLRSVLRAIPAADRGSIHFYDEQSRKLILKVSSFDYTRKTWGSLGFEVGVGLAGWVFEQQQPIIIENTIEDTHFKPPENPEVKTLSMLCIPITSRNRPIGVMTLSNTIQTGAFSPDDRDFLIGYADQAAVAIENAEQVTRTRKEADELKLLHSTSLKLNSSFHIGYILTTILESGNKLLGTEMAVVHWRGRSGEKIQTFVAPEELKGLATIPRPGVGLTAGIFRSGEQVMVPDASRDERLNPLVRAAGIQSLAGFPLQLGGRVAGVVFFNSRKRQFFGEHESRLLSLLLPAAAVAIENADIIDRIGRMQRLSEALVQVSSKLAASLAMEEQMAALKQFMQVELAAPMFFLGLYDEIDDRIHYKIDYQDGADQELTSIPMKNENNRWTISSYIVKEKSPVLWYDEAQKRAECKRLEINPLQVGTPCQTCLAFPLEVEGNRLGVISIQSQEPHAWDEIEVSTFQTLAHQAAIAIRNAQLMDESNNSFDRLKNTFAASQAITSEREPDKALEMLANSICTEFGAWRAYAVLMDEKGTPYHLSTSSGFNPPLELSTVIRKDGRSVDIFRSGEPIFIEDIHARPQEIHPKMIEQGVRAAACLPLTCKNAKRGVLWLHYDQPHRFLDRERETLRLYTSQAAIAYENARLHRQVNTAHERAAQVAQMMTVGDLKSTLDTIAKGMKDVLGCDIVTLYTYRQEKDTFDFPPSWAGEIRFPAKVTETGTIDRSAAPYRIIGLDDLYFSEDSQNDSILGTPFAEREDVRSSVAVPLKAHGRKVGVLFINYCHQKHTFTEGELQNIRLFSSQAAVAIGNEMLFEEEQKRREVLKIIDEAGRTVTGTLKLDEIFDNLAQQAYRLSGKEGGFASFASITLVESNRTILQAAYPQSEAESITRANAANVDLDKGVESRIGIIGRAVKMKEPQLVRNVKDDPDYLPACPKTQSELAVPILYGGEVFGVINLEHDEIGGLDEEDRQNIQSLAAHAAVAIQNAHIHQSLERKSRHRGAIYEASKIINASLERTEKELLALLVEQMVTKIVPAAGATNNLGVILSYDHEKNELKLESVYPVEALGANRIGETRSLSHPPHGRIGITSRAVLQKKPQRVNDVAVDPDYRNSHDKTRSELDVPMLEGDSVLGVLSLQCNQLNGFDEESEETMRAFAELAAIAIQNACRYRELKEARMTVGNMTAVAWMGLVSGTWRHSISNKAITISELTCHVQKDLAKGASGEKINQRLEKIKEIVEEIGKVPFPPLSDEEGVEYFTICPLVRDRINEFKQKKVRYGGIEYEIKISIDELAMVHASREWLRRILDILINNASNAMKRSDVKKITIALEPENEGVSILVSDTGTGIPDQLLPYLLIRPFKKKKREKGSGIGLFLANSIIQVYGGRLEMRSTGLDGTTMALWLPLQK